MPTHRSILSRTAIRGSIPSKKPTHHMVHYQGLLQRAYVYLLEYDDQVLCYEARPFSISCRISKPISHYTHDSRVICIHSFPRLITCRASAVTSARSLIR